MDSSVNTLGTSLFSLCLQFDLTILNGSTQEDVSEDFTNVAVHGNSVVEYIIVSSELRTACESLQVTHNAFSSHMCIAVDIVSS